MNYTVETIADALAAHLAPVLPGVSFYKNLNQQEMKKPCIFLQQQYGSIKPETGGYFLRTIGLDLICMEEEEKDLQERYQKTAETLDLHLKTFPYTDGIQSEPVLLRPEKREWKVEEDGLHYRFELRERVTIPKTEVKMQTIETYQEGVVE